LTEPPVIAVNDPEAFSRAIAVLRAGELVAVPTETVYGIACLPTIEAVERVVAAKERPPDKGLSLLVDSIGQVEAMVDVPDEARRLAARFWPGPLTIVLPMRDPAAVHPLIHGGTGSLGFRIPDEPFTRALARDLGPLILTSANVSGADDPRSAADVLTALGSRVALVIDGGPSPGGVPSTVLALSPDAPPRILRAGPLSVESIEAVLAI
jgi:L-threonylcarbamoyladenylate synthase